MTKEFSIRKNGPNICGVITAVKSLNKFAQSIGLYP